MRDLTGLRVVAVHAHPDDESLWTGGATAQLARRGADVTVVTCTLGEEGEVIGDTFSYLVADKADQLGGFRIGELSQSLQVLGARGEFLGGAGRWRDSGMVGTPSAEHPRAFVQSGTTAVEQLEEIFERIRPHLVLTYGPDGGYGHPDHIRAHELVHATSYRPQRVVWAVTPKEVTKTGIEAITKLPAGWLARPEEIAGVEEWDFEVPLSDEDYSRKIASMKAHPTQVWFADGTTSAVNPVAAFATVSDIAAAPKVFALSNLLAQPLIHREYYQLGEGEPVVDSTDIAAGLEF